MTVLELFQLIPFLALAGGSAALWRQSRLLTALTPLAAAAEAAALDKWHFLSELGKTRLVGFALLDVDGRYHYASAKAGEYFGFDVLGRSLAEIMPPKDAARMKDLIRLAAVERRRIVRSDDFKTPDGERSFVMELAPLIDAGGAVTGVLSVGAEVTALERAKQAAEAAVRDGLRTRRLLDTIAENSPAAMSVQDPDGHYLFANRRMQNAVGRDSILGLTESEIFPPHYARRVAARRKQALDTGKAVVTEEKLELAGNISAVMVVTAPLFEEGAAVGVCSLGIDISAQKERDLKLADYTARLEAVTAHMSNGLFIGTPEGMTYCNQRYQEILRLPPELSQPGTSPAQLCTFQNLRGDRRIDPTDGTLKLIETTSDPEIELCLFDGTVVNVRLTVLPNGGGVCTFEDITARRESEATLRAAKDAAEAATRAKSDFLANMSHELRTPLNAVIGFADLMNGEVFGPLNERYRDYVGIISQSGTHLLELIGDILDLSRIEAGRIELEPARIDIATIIESCLPLVSGRAARNGCRVETDLSPALTTVEADARRMKQILLNLITNAVKFTSGPSGLVLVRAFPTGQGVAVVVSDNGIGIAPEDIPRVLESWGQAHNDARQEGSGLGLPLSKRLVEMHGGSLELRSRLGHGTTVTVRLPARLPRPLSRLAGEAG